MFHELLFKAAMEIIEDVPEETSVWKDKIASEGHAGGTEGKVARLTPIAAQKRRLQAFEEQAYQIVFTKTPWGQPSYRFWTPASAISGAEPGREIMEEVEHKNLEGMISQIENGDDVEKGYSVIRNSKVDIGKQIQEANTDGEYGEEELQTACNVVQG